MADTGIRICINSQTPPVRFRLGHSELLEKYGELDSPIDLTKLEEGVDYVFSTGGVPAMLYPLLRRMKSEGIVSEAYWISLGTNAPYEVTFDGIRLYNVRLPGSDLRLYSNFKEELWREVHGLSKANINLQEYAAYARYNWLCGQTMLELLDKIDLVYVHDFQQLQVGGVMGPPAPALLQWHVPFDMEHVSGKFRRFILQTINDFDGLIVSTRKDLEGLIHAGHKGRAYQLYPYIDPAGWPQPSASELEKLRAKLQLREDDRVLLVVARMDPIKGQDLAIQAAEPFLRDGKVKLVLVGNGSFTGSREGGLSHPKAWKWHHQLEETVRDTNTAGSVLIAGYLNRDELNAAYAISTCVLVPSLREGFNLTTLEAWIHKKPVIVSTGAGSSELVNAGVNGYTFNPEPHDLRAKIEELLANPALGEKMGENGYDTAKVCYIDKSITFLQGIFTKIIEEFPGLAT